MKNLAVFHPSTELYGADRILVIALKAMVNFKPIIYLPSHGPLIDLIREELPSAEVKIIKDLPIISRGIFNPKGLVGFGRSYRVFKKLIKQENKVYNFQQVYVNTLACSLMLPTLSRLKVPVFTHVHEILEDPKIIAKLTAKMVFKYSHTVISVSKAVRDNLNRLVKHQKAKSCIVHNGIPAMPGEKNKSANEDLSFYLFGRIKPEKGQWYLLEALKQIPKAELKGVTFNFVGDVLSGREDLKSDLLSKIEAYGLKDAIVLHGFMNDIQDEMKKADICLIPSLMKDPFPTTVLEAMSAAKTVIASDTGGAKEAISHGENGFLIPANDPTVFAEVIRALINNKELIPNVGEQAKKAFNNRFTIEHFNGRWRNAIPEC